MAFHFQVFSGFSCVEVLDEEQGKREGGNLVRGATGNRGGKGQGKRDGAGSDRVGRELGLGFWKNWARF